MTHAQTVADGGEYARAATPQGFDCLPAAETRYIALAEDDFAFVDDARRFVDAACAGVATGGKAAWLGGRGFCCRFRCFGGRADTDGFFHPIQRARIVALRNEKGSYNQMGLLGTIDFIVALRNGKDTPLIE